MALQDFADALSAWPNARINMTKIKSAEAILPNASLKSEEREKFFQNLKQMVTHWRLAYEKLLTGEGDEYLIADFEEELDMHFRDGRFHAAHKKGLITKEEFQDLLAHCSEEWSNFVLKLRERAEENNG